MKKFILLLLTCTSVLGLQAQAGRISREEYINKYKDIAIHEMNRTGVPASIKLAQGMVETGNGNSRLATKGNNHFGIKCHNSWKGRKIYHDDDEKGECFRRYNSAEESFRDHSDFLRGSTRYSFLFELDPTDYKGWANGLKRAGYATSPTYASALIRIIEDNGLHQYDLYTGGIAAQSGHGEEALARTVYKRNRVKYIHAKEGDSFESLRREMKLLPNHILKYNDIEKTDSIYPGQELYIQPKRNRAEAGVHYHVVKEGETMHEISQRYAIKLDKLYDKNLMKSGSQPETGQQLSLRKQLKGTKPIREKAEKVPKEKRSREKIRETDKIEFEFIE